MMSIELSSIKSVKAPRGALVLAGLFAACLIVGTACADTTPESLTALGRNVYVSGVTYDPSGFFTGDSGTVTIYVTNGNANQSITVNHATFGDNDIRLISGTYDSSSAIGPLQTRSYTFSVMADSMDGTYYPKFSLNYFGSNTLWHQAPVKVENTPLVLLVTDTPDTFAEGRKDTIDVQVANPRKNEVKNVILSVSGDKAAIVPSKIFIGTLASGASTIVNFSVTPDLPTELALHVDYNNGDNDHSVETTLPIVFSDDKKQANPVISNVEEKIENGIYYVTGDVTNAGLLTANAVTVTSLSPAVPEDPYRSYVIGALKQDDFGSFEVTFRTENGEKSIPLELSYKDKDGNIITSRQQVSLSGYTESRQNNAGPDLVPVIALVVIIALAAGGYYYLKKRKNR